jgi:hypothetical protein
MQEALLNALRSQRPRIRATWAALLRAEPVRTPLGNPDALLHLLDWTLDEIFRDLSTLSTRRRPVTAAPAWDFHERCPCGRNPLLAYFAAGEQAMREALILAQVGLPGLDPAERDASLHGLDLVLHAIARREIEAFCGVCQFRALPAPAMAPGPASANAQTSSQAPPAHATVCLSSVMSSDSSSAV